MMNCDHQQLFEQMTDGGGTGEHEAQDILSGSFSKLWLLFQSFHLIFNYWFKNIQLGAAVWWFYI